MCIQKAHLAWCSCSYGILFTFCLKQATMAWTFWACDSGWRYFVDQCVICEQQTNKKTHFVASIHAPRSFGSSLVRCRQITSSTLINYRQRTSRFVDFRTRSFRQVDSNHFYLTTPRSPVTTVHSTYLMREIDWNSYVRNWQYWPLTISIVLWLQIFIFYFLFFKDHVLSILYLWWLIESSRVESSPVESSRVQSIVFIMWAVSTFRV